VRDGQRDARCSTSVSPAVRGGTLLAGHATRVSHVMLYSSHRVTLLTLDTGENAPEHGGRRGQRRTSLLQAIMDDS
jgi:hypothetical protein